MSDVGLVESRELVVIEGKVKVIDATRDNAHRRAMAQFTKLCEKYPNGFDFTVPSLRKDLFEAEMNELSIVFYDIAESYADLCNERMSLLNCIKKLDFKKRQVIIGIGIFA